MIYPKFLQKDDLIGVTALSSGCGLVIKELKTAIKHFKEEFNVILTSNVYGDDIVSSSKERRLQELEEVLQEDIKMLLIARGGNFLYETLDGIPFNKIVSKKIWVSGYSDPTSLLYILTTKYDLSTIYGFNAKSFDNEKLFPYQENYFKIIKGHLKEQKSFHDRPTISLNGDFSSKGIIIGGCLDVLRYIIGTSYDNTLNFIEKYKNYKVIWYFDIYNMDSIDTYLTLLQLKEIGWFKYSDTILFGSVLYPQEEYFTYQEAYQKVFSNMNIIIDTNIGHVKPNFTIINGSLTTVTFQNNELMMKEELL